MVKAGGECRRDTRFRGGAEGFGQIVRLSFLIVIGVLVLLESWLVNGGLPYGLAVVCVFVS